MRMRMCDMLGMPSFPTCLKLADAAWRAWLAGGNAAAGLI